MMGRILTLCLLLPLAAQADDRVFGSWTLTTVEDAAAYATFMSLQQDSSTAIKDEDATKDVVPRLSFRCRPGAENVIARIDWGRFISSFSTEAGFKVDDGKRTWLKWKVDGSEQVTISPDADDTQRLVAQLSDGATLEVEISPYSQGPVTASFAVDGFADGIAALKASCQ